MPIRRIPGWFRCLTLAAAIAAQAQAAEPRASEIVTSIRQAGLDASECYRVRDFSFVKEDLRVYFNEGYLIFSKPVLGRRPWVIFSGDVEGGDAEIILIPPTRSERQSLAKFTESPNLNEHLRSAFIVSTDGAADELLERLQKEGVRKAPEAAPLLIETWAPVVTNIAQPMEVRVVQDLLAPRTSSNGILFLAVSGKTLGNFDVIFDSRANRRIAVRKRNERNGRSVYEVWTSFLSRSSRMSPATRATGDFTLTHYGIDATVNNDVYLKVVSRATVKIGANATRVFPLEIANAMRVTSVKIDGNPAELLAGDSVRGRITPRGEESTFLTIAPELLQPGSEHEFQFEHEGNVITAAGDGVYFVNARGSWYPHLSAGFSTYDLTFRYPKRLTLVTPGEMVSDREEGDQRVTRRRSDVPMEAAGFNLGDYEKVTATVAGIALDVYGNKHLAESLKPRVIFMRPLPPPPPMTANGGRGPATPRLGTEPIPILQPAPDPLARLKSVAADMSSALEFYSGLFGPPALKTLTVAPIPGTFGQGFPGLVYLSTFAYIEASERPAALRSAREQVFFSDLITSHEAAHQWWGSVVTVGRNEDEWILEALANYSSLLWLEKKRGFKEAMKVLDGYRDELTSPDQDLESRDAAGPIVWGERLQTSGNAEAWRTITYGKGAWIMHMLRRRMGDERFLAMLAELRRRFEFRAVSAEAFQALAEEFRPKGMNAEVIDTFFENWVFASGIPSLRLRSSVKGTPPAVKLSGTIEQSSVDGDFTVDVPVEVQIPRGSVQTFWVRTSDDAKSFEVNLKQPPGRVAIPDDVLMKK